MCSKNVKSKFNRIIKKLQRNISDKCAKDSSQVYRTNGMHSNNKSESNCIINSYDAKVNVNKIRQ